MAIKKKRKEKTTPFGVNLMRSQVLYQAAQISWPYSVHLADYASLTLQCKPPCPVLNCTAMSVRFSGKGCSSIGDASGFYCMHARKQAAAVIQQAQEEPRLMHYQLTHI